MKRPSVVATVASMSVLALLLALGGSADGLVIEGFFSDDNGTTFENDIDAIAQAGITKGCNPPANTNYCPKQHVLRGQMAAFLRRALNLPSSGTDYFVDDNNSIFENDINAIAAAGITKGCNPPTNNRFCPDDPVERGPMAAFLRRAFQLPLTQTDHFVDDNNSVFENDINAIAEEGITKGCNPPTNSRYCPDEIVDRGAMAAFLRRAMDLPSLVLSIPLSDRDVVTCDKEGESCTLTVDIVAGRPYRVEEGLFQVLPATTAELGEFNSTSTNFALTVDGNAANLSALPTDTEGNVTTRSWRTAVTFGTGTHTLVGRWRWDGDLVQTVTVTVRAGS